MPVMQSEVPIDRTAEVVPFAGVNRAAPNQTNRMIKCARPVCEECKAKYNPKGKRPDWWKACIANGHNPYVRYRDKVVTEKKYTIREDGARVLGGTTEVIYSELILNVAQIPQSEDSNAGRGLEKAVIFKGYKTLDRLGYGIRCEMAGCSVHAKFQCQYGNFCSDQHARRVGYDRDVVVHEVYDQKKRDRQMEGINIRAVAIKQPKPKKAPKKEKETADA